ncbi:hypothetical protein R3P38DRAFT_3346677 [Favolaschia claudopus]|uniref:Uncharacterized protein n=1 Tax=Favolaschia claudopus TaxID=2862362 RepID=A0AAW0D6R5_9AGAR
MVKTQWSDKTCHAYIFGLGFVPAVKSVALHSNGSYNRFMVGIYAVKPITHLNRIHTYWIWSPLIVTCSVEILLTDVPRLFTFYAFPPVVMCGSAIVAFGPQKAPILTIFMRDGLFWFLALVVIGTIEIGIWNKGRHSLANLVSLPGAVATAIISTRVILNLKQMTVVPAISTGQTIRPEREVHRPHTVSTDDWRQFRSETSLDM